MAEAKRMAPFELIQTIESARYRAMREADAHLYGAYLLVRTWLGKKAPKFEKVLGRRTAVQFKAACLGRDKKTDKKLEEEFRRLRAKIEERDNGGKRNSR